MKIGIDSRFLSKISQGTGTYTFNLINNLKDIISYKDELFLVNKHNTTSSLFSNNQLYYGKLRSNFTPYNCFMGYRNMSNKYKLDILHTNYINSIIPTRSKLLVTIHDVLFKTHRQFFPNKLSLGIDLLSKLSLSNSDFIITVSEYSKSKILEFYPFLENRIDVTYEAASSSFKKIEKKQAINRVLKYQLNINKPYILFVGRFAPIKNIEALIEFYSTHNKIENDFDLVLVGDFDKSFPNPNLEKIILGNSRIHVFSGITNDDLNILYNGARLFYFVSHGEGFGLPILEAMNAGCPVITSNTTSCNEIAGMAAYKVNPNDKDEIFYGIDKMLYDDDLCSQFSDKGLTHAQEFTWKKCAEKTYDIYKKVI